MASVNFWPRGCRIWRNISTGCLGWMAKLDVAYFGREKVWTSVFVGVIRTFFKHILHILVVFSHFPQLWKAVGGKIKTTQGGFPGRIRTSTSVLVKHELQSSRLLAKTTPHPLGNWVLATKMKRASLFTSLSHLLVCGLCDSGCTERTVGPRDHQYRL